MWEPLREPKLLKHGLFRDKIRVMVRRNRAQYTELEQVARQLYQAFLKGEPFMVALQMFFDICYTVNSVSVEVVGVQPDRYVDNEILLETARVWVMTEVVTQNDHLVCEQLAGRLKESGSWYYPKVYHLGNMIGMRLNTESFAQLLRLPVNLELLCSHFGISLEGVAESIDGIVEGLHEHRKYGIKPAFFQDGVLHRPSDAWVITGTDEVIQAGLDRFGGYRDHTMALVSLEERRSIRSLDSKFEVEKGAHYKMNLVTRGGKRAQAWFVWFLDWRGELNLFPNGEFPVRDIFARLGKDVEYLAIRLATILRIYDLTVPLEVVRQSPPLPRRGILTKLPGGKARNLTTILNPRLVVPRIRFLDDPRLLAEQFEREVEEDEKRTRIRMRQHTVVGHTRQLPPGHNASPGARILAMDDGVTLRDGETYVRKHTRGTGKQVGVNPHRAVRR